MFVIPILVMCTVLLYLVWRYPRPKSHANPPPYPGALPIIGHGHLLIGNDAYLWKIIKDMIDTCVERGGVLTVNTGPQTQYLITDLDDCLTISGTTLTKHYFYEFGKPWLGSGLLTADEQTWKRHRKLISPAFNQQIITNYISIFNDQSRLLLNKLDIEVGKGPFQHRRYILKHALETACRTAMDFKVNESDLNEIYLDQTEKMLSIFINRLKNVWMHSDYLYRWTLLRKRQDETIKTITEISCKYIQERKQKLIQEKGFATDTNRNTGKSNTLIDLLLEMNLDNLLSDTEVREELDTVIAANYDTSAVTLSVVLLRLGSRLDVQERAYEEIQNVFGDSDRDVEKDDLPKLIYLEGVIKETLRLNPTIPIVARVTNKEMNLRNCILPVDSNCFLSIYSLNRNPVWGTDAEDFKPERWLDPTRIPNNVVKFSTFGVGKRSCIGKIYALMSLKTTLVYLIRRYRITADYDKIVFKINGLLKPASGEVICIERRK